jgi:hypothetical protein
LLPGQTHAKAIRILFRPTGGNPFLEHGKSRLLGVQIFLAIRARKRVAMGQYRQASQGQIPARRKEGLFVFVYGDITEKGAHEFQVRAKRTKSEKMVTMYRHSQKQIDALMGVFLFYKTQFFHSC